MKPEDDIGNAPFLEGKQYWSTMLNEGYTVTVVDQLITEIYYLKVKIARIEDQLREQSMPVQRHPRRKVSKKG